MRPNALETSMDKDSQTPMPAPVVPGSTPKRPYSTPKVAVHGSLAELTLAAKTAGIPDADSVGSHVSDLL